MVVLFDIDGTLIDHNLAEGTAVAAFHRTLGLCEPLDDFRCRWRSAVERHYDRYLAGEISIQEQRRVRLREIVDAGLSDAVADELSVAYLNDYLAACELYPDVKPMLAQLNSYGLGIVSNGEMGQQQTKLTRAGILHHFRAVILSAECGIAKPAVGIFHQACAALGVQPSDAVHVGDRRDVDAEAARAAGLHGIWLDRTASGEHDDPRIYIRSLSALPAAIAMLERAESKDGSTLC